MDIESIAQTIQAQIGDEFAISSQHNFSEEEASEVLTFKILHAGSVVAERLELLNVHKHDYKVKLNLPNIRSARLSDENIHRMKTALTGFYL